VIQRSGPPMIEFGNVIAAFSEKQVERLTGLTSGRLRYWDNTDFFKPSLGDDNRRVAYGRVYTFKDVATLRVLATLVNRHKIPLQHLRKVREKLADMGENRWTRTTLMWGIERSYLTIQTRRGARNCERPIHARRNRTCQSRGGHSQGGGDPIRETS